MKLILGPCQIESLEHARKMCDSILNATSKYKVDLYYKSSFDKANRTSTASARGVGLEHGAEILSTLREEFQIKTLTDVHETWQCDYLKSSVDVLQIPAFLSRQTDLIAAAANTGLTVNIKKGQFMSPYDIKHAIDKVTTGKVWATERGSSFGYNNLVVDFRSLVIMKEFGKPVIFDGTHSVQQPSAMGNRSGGQKEFIEPLCRAAIAVGVDGLFLETHDDPTNAPSDAATQIDICELAPMLNRLL